MTAPGFYHNLHSINHFHISETPWFKDLEPRRPRHLHHAALRVRPAASRRHARWCSAAISRRRWPTSRASPRRTRRPSATGTARPRRSPRKSSCRSASPIRCRRPSARRCCRKSDIGRDFLAVTRRQPFDVVKELFENEHVQLLFLFKISLFGTWLVDTLSKTSPMGSVIRAFDLQSGYQLCQGGSFNLARGADGDLHRGGRHATQPQVELDRIVIEGGKATGIALEGRPHRAGQAVRRLARSTCTRPSRTLIGRAQLPAAFLKKLDDFQYTTWTLFGLHLALHEPVRFAAEKFDPNIHRTLKWSARRRDDGGIARRASGRDGRPRAEDRAVRLGPAERARPDPGAARQAHDLCLARHAARARHRRARTTRPSRRSSPSGSSRSGRSYAPNMTRKNIIAQHVYTAQRIHRRRSRRCAAATSSWARSTPSR